MYNGCSAAQDSTMFRSKFKGEFQIEHYISNTAIIITMHQHHIPVGQKQH